MVREALTGAHSGKVVGAAAVETEDVVAHISAAAGAAARPLIPRVRPGRRRRPCCLRNCASNDIVLLVLGEITVSSEIDRQRYAAIGRALADPKRLCVLESLASGELSVGDLSATVGCQIPNMSQHLAVLRSAGLAAARREGSTVFYRLTDPRVLKPTDSSRPSPVEALRDHSPWRRSST